MKTKNIIPYLLFLILLCACESNDGLASVLIKDHEINLKNIRLGDSVYHTFKIKNISKTPLTLFEVSTSCDCTAIEFTKKPIKQDEIGVIDVIIKPTEIGHLEKNIVLEANTLDAFHVFKIFAFVLE